MTARINPPEDRAAAAVATAAAHAIAAVLARMLARRHHAAQSPIAAPSDGVSADADTEAQSHNGR